VSEGVVVIVGGTSGLGLRLAEKYAARGTDVVITGRDSDRCAERAAAIQGPGTVTPIALDLAEPERIARALEAVGPVSHLVLAAIERDYNSVLEYDIPLAIRLVTLKLVGYTEPPLRRAGVATPVSGVDHGHDGERRDHRPRPDARRPARAGPRQRDPPRDRGRLARVG
jgi:uncharacterized protein YbjT (DUF2867 family)